MNTFAAQDFCDSALRMPKTIKDYFSQIEHYNSTKNATVHATIKKHVQKHWPEMMVFTRTIKHILDAKGYCVIRGFPVPGKIGDLCLLGFSLLLGTPTATDVVEKKIIWPVKSIHYVKGMFTTISEDVYEADLHTDTQYFPRPEKYVILACIKPAKNGGVTTLVDGRRVIASLQQTTQGRKVLTVLRTKQFPIRIPTSYTKLRKDNVPEIIVAPLLSKIPLIRFRIDTIIRGMELCPKLVTKEMISALHYFHKALENYPAKKSYKLQEGEMLITNNHVILHGRTKFKDRNRTLKRIRIEA